MKAKLFYLLLGLFIFSVPLKKSEAGGPIRNPAIFIFTVPIILGVASIFTMAILQQSEIDAEMKTAMQSPLVKSRPKTKTLKPGVTIFSKKSNLERDFLEN